MLQHLVRQRPDLRQRQIRAGLQIIRERAHTPVADADVELVIPAGAVAVSAAGQVGAEAQVLGRRDADYVLAFGVGGVEGFVGGVDCVAEDLDDGFGVFVFEFGEGAEAGAAAVEAEGGDGGAGRGDSDDDEGEEGCEGCGGMHGDVMKKGVQLGERERERERSLVKALFEWLVNRDFIRNICGCSSSCFALLCLAILEN